VDTISSFINVLYSIWSREDEDKCCGFLHVTSVVNVGEENFVKSPYLKRPFGI
jgi:hypothetical protein